MTGAWVEFFEPHASSKDNNMMGGELAGDEALSFLIPGCDARLGRRGFVEAGAGGGRGSRRGGDFGLLGGPPENIPGDRMGPISGFRRMGGNHYQLPDHGKSARQYSAGLGSGTSIPRRAVRPSHRGNGSGHQEVRRGEHGIPAPYRGGPVRSSFG